jgi:RNA polymerase sigma-70 factor, ECF subfamily
MLRQGTRMDDPLKIEPKLSIPPPTPEEIVRDYAPRVYHLVRRLLGNEADAEDVTQEALLQAIRKLHTFRGESSFSTWLHKLGVNAALAHRRKQASRDEHRVPDIGDELFHGNGHHAAPIRRWSVTPEETALSRESQDQIEAAIARLPEGYREVYVLADVEGMSNAEIGDILELGVPAVKSRLHRARLMMRNALAPYFEEVA